jgi:hypothetical protein
VLVVIGPSDHPLLELSQSNWIYGNVNGCKI